MTDTSLASIPVTELRGVGEQVAKRLQKLNIHTVQDVLFHLPARYQDRTQRTPIGSLRFGEEAVIEGVIRASGIRYGRRRSLVCALADDSGEIGLRFFHFNRIQQNHLKPGAELRCFGEVRRGQSGLEMYHPEYTLLGQSTPALEQSLTPIYPATEGISQHTLRRLAEGAFAKLNEQSLAELLPAGTLPKKKSLLHGDAGNLQEALHYLHAPPPDARLQELAEGTHPCQRRLAFEELLSHHLSLMRLRSQVRQTKAPPLSPPDPALQQRFLERLGFTLTGAQKRVGGEIEADLSQKRPMLRLLQGDVGSGKTAVAALAALQAIANGFQTALMAPTEVLAEQHFLCFDQWFSPLGIQIAWLTSRVKGKRRQEALQRLRTGDTLLAIGTHALLQEDVHFSRIGLVIIDEQHRFGVHQRLTLREKSGSSGHTPHQLIMTATPIPRTLSMLAYADLDHSILNELPPGRKPVKTLLLSAERRDEVIRRMREACRAGRQAYWVCTLIEESEVLQCEAAEDTAVKLRAELPEIEVGLIHGRCKTEEKTATMKRFKEGEIQLLVATTVIEVGMDVPNTSLMVIENPERLGLAQLHQLRGRISRGNQESYCLLLYGKPLSAKGRERLEIIRRCNDGFLIAQEDLKIRGPGEVLGTRQTGLATFKIADLQRDEDLLEDAHQSAQKIMKQHPERAVPLVRRWLGEADRYGEA